MSSSQYHTKTTFYVEALGCPSSQYEGEALRSLLLKDGFLEAHRFSPEVYIINTCAVTEAAVRKVRKTVRRVKKNYPNTMIVLTGCYPQLFSREIIANLPEVDILLGNEGRASISELIKKRLSHKQIHRPEIQTNIPWNLVNNKTPSEPLQALTDNMDYRRMRPVIKIQEGCHRSCSYCIVSQARGVPRSLPPESVYSQAKNYLMRGYREIILAGTNLGLYGYDLNNYSYQDKTQFRQYQSKKSLIKDQPLIRLLSELNKLPYHFRIRLSYLEPGSVTEKLLEAMYQNDKVCPYLYLPVQSASDRILHKMERDYTVQDLDNIIRLARRNVPDISIQADLIVGFPGETEEDHRQTLKKVRQWELSSLHVFTYSPRPQTKAASWKQIEVPPETQKQRYHEMQKLNQDLLLRYHQKMHTKTLRVLVERIDKKIAKGFSDNNIWVHFPVSSKVEGKIKGNFVQVTPLIATPEGIEGQA